MVFAVAGLGATRRDGIAGATAALWLIVGLGACGGGVIAGEDGSSDSAQSGSTGPLGDSSSSAESEEGPSFVPDDSDDESDSGENPVDSHADDIQPIWFSNCVTYCHGGLTPMGDFSLESIDAYDQLLFAPSAQVDMPMVTPGSPDESYLWHKLLGTHLEVGGEGYSMPAELPILSDTKLDRIEEWILIGAPP